MMRRRSAGRAPLVGPHAQHAHGLAADDERKPDRRGSRQLNRRRVGRFAGQQLFGEIAPLQHFFRAARVARRAPATRCLAAPAPTHLSVPAIAGRCWPIATRMTVKVERAASAWPNATSRLELFGAMLGVLGRPFRRLRPWPAARWLSAVLMEEEGAGQQHESRHQRQPALPLDLARVVEQPRNRRREHDDERRRQSAAIRSRSWRPKSLIAAVPRILPAAWCKLVA